MKTLKEFLSSKINWSAIVMILISLQNVIAKQDFSVMQPKDWFVFAMGILIIIFRTWFTNTESAASPKI